MFQFIGFCKQSVHLTSFLTPSPLSPPVFLTFLSQTTFLPLTLFIMGTGAQVFFCNVVLCEVCCGIAKGILLVVGDKWEPCVAGP